MPGSIFLDLALHNIDTICALAGGEFPVTVTAQGHAFSKEVAATGTYDQAVVTMKFASGLIAHVELSRFCCYGYDQRLEVCTKYYIPRMWQFLISAPWERGGGDIWGCARSLILISALQISSKLVQILWGYGAVRVIR